VKRNTGSGSIKQIKRILNEATPSKSKWANDDRIGQEQLYEALEKVLTVLKNYTEHSLPFLKPVQKRDAPNYYDLIKNPMDLSTMTKKLRSFVYNSKSEFVKDLDLIWSNCLEYNTIPESIYRKHAFAMKKRSAELLMKVPEIEVQNAAELSDCDDGSQLDREMSVGPSIQSINASEPNPIVPLNNLVQEEPMEVDEKEAPTPENSEDVHMELSDRHDEDGDSEPKLQQMQEDPTYDSCMLIRKWKSVTTSTRVAKLQRMVTEKDLPLKERRGIMRTEKLMDSYAHSIYSCHARLAMQHLKFDLESNVSIAAEDMSYCFPEVFYPGSTFPDCYIGYPKFYEHLQSFFSWQNQLAPEIPIAPLPSLSEYDSSYFNTGNHLAACMANNISELKEIKEIHSKILSIPSAGSEILTSLPICEPYERTWNSASLPPYHLDEEGALGLVKKSCSWILAHQGFDGVSALAIATLSEIMVELLINAGRTLKSYIDRFGAGMPMEEMVLHSLSKLGVSDPSELQTYVNHDIIRYGRKLHDLKQRLHYAWTDLQVRLS
jgi:hypothetical protein